MSHRRLIRVLRMFVLLEALIGLIFKTDIPNPINVLN
jgi:hypothetical protein